MTTDEPGATEVLQAMLLPDTFPVGDHECGYELREGLGYLAVEPDCQTCCDQATAKWKAAWNR